MKITLKILKWSNAPSLDMDSFKKFFIYNAKQS